MPAHDSNSQERLTQTNRFAARTFREPYSEKAGYLKAMAEVLTPDVWDAILIRAVHDATLGNRTERTKARDWLGKYILPLKAEAEVKPVTRADFHFLAEVYTVLHDNARTDQEAEEALAVAIGSLAAEERATFARALETSNREDIQTFWKDMIEQSEREKATTGPSSSVVIYNPGEGTQP